MADGLSPTDASLSSSKTELNSDDIFPVGQDYEDIV